ncbi:DUF262 domain-containing protein, partial [Spirochaetales bacterium BR151]
DQASIFIPIDGQQRLTTLWLLHLYAFHNDEAVLQKLSKFSYKTRKSSRQFLEHLITHCHEIFTSALMPSPSQEISDSAWFLPAWRYDPTVASMLTMLDDMTQKFNQSTQLDLATRLQEGYLHFQFLDTKVIGSEDDLYIKLNARGKALSPFDNLKSIIIEQIILHEEQLKQVYHIDRWEYEQLFDGDWTDYFWHRSKENFDTDFLLFLTFFFRNCRIIEDIKDGWWFGIDKHKLDTTVLMSLYHTLNFLISANAEKVDKFLFKIPEKTKKYEDVISSYGPEAYLLFHVVIQYCAMAKRASLDATFMADDSSKQWFRIFWNLIINSNNTIDRWERALEAITEINRLSDHWQELLRYCADKKKIGVFDSKQIAEEQFKAQILLDHPKKDTFTQAIYNAEKHHYFLGQIRSALYLSLKDDKKTIELSSLEKFEEYWQKLSKLFEDMSEKNMHVLRRALLTYGDYRLKVDSQKTLCVTSPRSATSLRMLFADRYQEPNLKQFLDDLSLETDINTQLKIRIKAYVANKNHPFDWRDCMIMYEALWDKRYLHPNLLYTRKMSGKFLLLRSSKASGYTYEVFITSLKSELDRSKSKLTELGLKIELWGNRSATDDHCLVIYKEKENVLATVRYDYTKKCFTVDRSGCFTMDEMVTHMLAHY